MFDYPDFIKESQKNGLENTLRLFYGVYHAICVENDDPDKQGRIKLKVPQIAGDQALDVWAYPIATAGNNAGFLAVPAVGDGVWVSFENGNPRFPQYNGGWWARPEGESEIPDEAKDDYPDVEIWKSKERHFLLFNNRRNVIRLENSLGGFIEISDNLVKLYGESEPAVLGDKNGDLHNDDIEELKNTVTQLNTLITALNVAMAAFGVASPLLLPAATAFTTATVPIVTQLGTITANLITLQTVRIPQTKSTKVKLD